MKTYIVSAVVIVALAVIAYLLVTYEDMPADQSMEQGQESMMDNEGDAMMLNRDDVEGDIVGTWQSTEDPKAVVVYKADGTVEDRYDGEVMSTGTWELYADGEAEYDPSSVFLRTTIDGETYEYAVLDSGESQLTINYLARGNTLDYERVTEDDGAMMEAGVEVDASVQ